MCQAADMQMGSSTETYTTAQLVRQPIRFDATQNFVGKLESRLETSTLLMSIIPTSHPAYPPVGVRSGQLRTLMDSMGESQPANFCLRDFFKEDFRTNLAEGLEGKQGYVYG